VRPRLRSSRRGFLLFLTGARWREKFCRLDAKSRRKSCQRPQGDVLPFAFDLLYSRLDHPRAERRRVVLRKTLARAGAPQVLRQSRQKLFEQNFRLLLIVEHALGHGAKGGKYPSRSSYVKPYALRGRTRVLSGAVAVLDPTRG
jgi:hypothetical protein